MYRLVTLGSLLLSLNVWAASPGSIDSITLARRVRTDTQNLIVLMCKAGFGAANTANTCFKDNAAYQVPAGKTFRIIGLRIVPGAAAAQASQIALGYHSAAITDAAKAGTHFGVSATDSAFNHTYSRKPRGGAAGSDTTWTEYNLENNGPVVLASQYPWVSDLQGDDSVVSIFGIEE